MTEPTIIVTGAASGIGYAAACRLGDSGRRVVLCDHDATELARAADAIEKGGGRAIPRLIDLRDAEATVELVAEVARQAPIGAIVHSAGIFPQLTFAESTLADFDRVMAINLRAAFALMRAGVDTMADRGGALVFLTSGAGLPEAATDPFQRRFALYGASKAALDRLALGIADEVAEKGIAVSTITPGAFVATTGTAGLDLAAAHDLSTIAVEDVGRAVAWLAETPRMALAGKRLRATDFGKTWGPAG